MRKILNKYQFLLSILFEKISNLELFQNLDDRMIDEVIGELGIMYLNDHSRRFQLLSDEGSVSGGERQRIALLRSIINKPSIVFADEPTGNLDDENVHIMIKLIRELRINYKTSFVIATHDERLCDIANKIFDIKNCNLSLNR